MFQKADMSVMDWYLFWILMAIPFVNIIILILIMLSSNSNGSLRSMLWAQAILAILVTILFMTVLQPYMREIWNFLSQVYPINQFVS
ncbi:MAG: hypothetical protein PHP32_05985 [Candidatus Izemoplasmatales bacterium]|nr:hypothetical protein [Candidatus Izemoplasmatales bacterium]